MFNTLQQIHVMRPKQPLQKSRVCVYIYLCVCIHTLHVYTYVRKMLYIPKGKKAHVPIVSIYGSVCTRRHSCKRQGRQCVLFAAGGGGVVAKSCPAFATPWTVAHQAPLSVGFSRQA